MMVWELSLVCSYGGLYIDRFYSVLWSILKMIWWLVLVVLERSRNVLMIIQVGFYGSSGIYKERSLT